MLRQRKRSQTNAYSCVNLGLLLKPPAAVKKAGLAIETPLNNRSYGQAPLFIAKRNVRNCPLGLEHRGVGPGSHGAATAFLDNWPWPQRRTT